MTRHRDSHARRPSRPPTSRVRGHATARTPLGMVEELVREPLTRVALLCLAVLLAGSVAAMRLYLQKVGPLPGDQRIADRFPNPRVPGPVEQIAGWFANIATPGVALLTVAVLVVLIDRWLGRARAIGVVLCAASAAFNTALKHFWGATPLWDRIKPEQGLNFPSGHVTYATALFGFLAFLALERRRGDLAAVAVLVVLGMGPSRVIDGSHLPSDVVAGYLLGLAWLICVVLLVTRGQKLPSH